MSGRNIFLCVRNSRRHYSIHSFFNTNNTHNTQNTVVIFEKIVASFLSCLKTKVLLAVQMGACFVFSYLYIYDDIVIDDDIYEIDDVKFDRIFCPEFMMGNLQYYKYLIGDVILMQSLNDIFLHCQMDSICKDCPSSLLI